MNDDDELLERLGSVIEPPVPPLDPNRARAVRALAADATASADGPGATPLRSRRSILGLGALAAGSAAAGIAVGAGIVAALDEDPAPLPLEPVDDLAIADGVTATASLIDHTWGLEVVLDVEGLEPGTPYAMAFETTSGDVVGAGGFVGAEGLMRCRNNGAVLKAEVARWAVVAPDGSEVVAAVVV